MAPEHPLFPRYEFDHLLRAGLDTETASQADVGIQPGLLFGRFTGIVGRHKAQGFDRADMDALPAPVAVVFRDFGQEIGGVHRVEQSESPGGDHCLAAAAAAVADEIDPIANVLAELNQVVVVSLLKEGHPPCGGSNTSRHPRLWLYE